MPVLMASVRGLTCRRLQTRMAWKRMSRSWWLCVRLCVARPCFAKRRCGRWQSGDPCRIAKASCQGAGIGPLLFLPDFGTRPKGYLTVAVQNQRGYCAAVAISSGKTNFIRQDLRIFTILPLFNDRNLKSVGFRACLAVAIIRIKLPSPTMPRR